MSAAGRGGAHGSVHRLRLVAETTHRKLRAFVSIAYCAGASRRD